MKSYADFCKRYELDPRSADSRHQYQAYRDNLAALLAAARRPADPTTSDQSNHGHPAS